MTLSIAVICGGRSTEAEVSRASASRVASALGSRGHRCAILEVDDLEVDAELWPALQAGGFGLAFLAVHGRFGEDGTVQGICELLDLPYTGSDVLATALCYDKVMAKRVFVAEGITTPAWALVSATPDDIETAMRMAAERLGLPLVVKPRHGGSTIGLSIVGDPADLVAAHATAAAHGEVLCEKFIAGTEITIGILGHNPPQALPTLEIVSQRPLYDYAAKYTAGQSQHIIPARIPEPQRVASQQSALRAHVALGCRDLSRVDIIVDDEGTPWILEVNAIPGLTDLSLLPDAARASGIEFSQVCELLVDAALSRHQATGR